MLPKERQVRAQGPLSFLRRRSRLRVRMRRRAGHAGGESEADRRADSSRKGAPPANRQDAHGIDQAKLNTRIREERAKQLSPTLTPTLALSPLPNPNLHLTLTLLRLIPASGRHCGFNKPGDLRKKIKSSSPGEPI